MHKEWDNIERELSEQGDAHVVTMRVWVVIGLIALVSFIAMAIVEGV